MKQPPQSELKRQLSMAELLGLLAIMAVISALAIPVLKLVASPVLKRVVSPRPFPNPGSPTTFGYPFYAFDEAMAMEVSQVLSNAGYRLQTLDSKKVLIRRSH